MTSEILKFEIQVDGVWTLLNPIFNDLKIIKQRDKTHIFVERTTCDVELVFEANDYEKVINFAGAEVDGRMTETIHGHIKVYDVVFIFSTTWNAYLKRITSEVLIKDEYFYILDKPTNFQYNEDVDLRTNVFGLRSSGTLVNDTNSVRSEISILPMKQIVRKLIDNINGAIFMFDNNLSFSWNVENIRNLSQLILVNDENIEHYGETITPLAPNYYEGRPFVTSLEKILTLLREKLFLSWYFIPAPAYFQYYFGVDYLFIIKSLSDTTIFQNMYDFTSFEDNKDKMYTLINDNNFSLCNYITFNFDNNSNQNKAPFATKKIKFQTSKTENKDVQLTAEADISQLTENRSGKLFMLDVESGFGKYFDIKKYNKQWYNYDYNPFTYAAGDSDSLTVSDTGTHGTAQIRISQIYFPNELKFIITSSIYDSHLLFCYVDTNGNTQKIAIDGAKTIIFQNNYHFPIWLENYGTVSQRTLTFQIYAIGNLNDYVLIRNDINYIENYSLSNEKLLTTYACEMPQSVGTIDGISYNMGISNNFQQNMQVDFQSTIDELNMKGLVKTSIVGSSDNWLRIDKAERSYSNTFYSKIRLLLSGKINDYNNQNIGQNVEILD